MKTAKIHFQLEIPELVWERLRDVARRDDCEIGDVIIYCLDNVLNFASDAEQYQLYKEFRATCPDKHLHPRRGPSGQVFTLFQ